MVTGTIGREQHSVSRNTKPQFEYAWRLGLTMMTITASKLYNTLLYLVSLLKNESFNQKLSREICSKDIFHRSLAQNLKAE
jgi:hypothetical protein